MSFPYMNPHTIVVTPNDPDANLADVPIFQSEGSMYLTAAKVFARQAITGANANYVDVAFHELGNTSNVYANINIIAGTNITANTWTALTVQSDAKPLSADDTVALTATFKVVSGANFGASQGTVLYQLDYVQGSPASDGE